MITDIEWTREDIKFIREALLSGDDVNLSPSGEVRLSRLITELQQIVTGAGLTVMGKTDGYPPT